MMDAESWHRERDDRTIRYAGRRLDPHRPIHITIADEYAESYSGQVALLVASNLLSRMSPLVLVDAPETRVLERLPGEGSGLIDVALNQMKRADPYGRFEQHRHVPPGAFHISLGRQATANTAFGSGWNAFVGAGAPPFALDRKENPFGAALAAVMVSAQAFATELRQPSTATVINAYHWSHEVYEGPELPAAALGDAWLVGCGSVGTAIAYFLSLAQVRVRWTLVDGDVVKVHNLDRSPTFVASDVGRLKALALGEYLRSIGVDVVDEVGDYLHSTTLMQSRESGTPDVLFAAANEHDVRYLIESALPPLQLYGTTGKNWQASSIRHIPMRDACSCCLFPPDAAAQPDTCATQSPEPRSPAIDQVDAALPFLSFAAGLMTATDAFKLAVGGISPSDLNRVTLYTYGGEIRATTSTIPRREDCLCASRGVHAHRTMVAGTRFAALGD